MNQVFHTERCSLLDVVVCLSNPPREKNKQSFLIIVSLKNETLYALNVVQHSVVCCEQRWQTGQL